MYVYILLYYFTECMHGCYSSFQWTQVYLLSTDLQRTSAVCRSSGTTAPVTDSTATTSSKFVKDIDFTMHMHFLLHKI